MNHAGERPFRCTYVVPLARTRSVEDLVELSHYLSDLQLAGCDVLVLDGSEASSHPLHRRILRWVGRYEGARPGHRTSDGAVDFLRASADRATQEKVIVAEPEIRFSTEALESTIALLDRHEGVELQEYIDPLPVWAAIDAAHSLLRRGLESEPKDGRTFAFRRSTARLLRSRGDGSGEGHARRFLASGGEVVAALDVFVQRRPLSLPVWTRRRPTLAASEFDSYTRAVAFLTLLPLLMLVGISAGLEAAAAVVMVASILAMSIALRGRAGAAHAFPLRAVFFAPVWLFERSFAIYGAFFMQMRTGVPDPEVAATSVAHGSRAASGE